MSVYLVDELACCSVLGGTNLVSFGVCLILDRLDSSFGLEALTQFFQLGLSLLLCQWGDFLG